ncbi:hypothetical protein OHA57_17920 [Streptomyces anulatus]|uniref:hypothetical protein n=1 Tax=Streptomyces griseus group TaxID=629295 RepID=UPI002DDBB52F|nr:hypothetical protein [Streptomyces anulatus]WSC62491.1 hypothetical protein OHA57_17920 [Streptomyces anulatus]WSI78768.1 hypothetical protein OG557_18305 [Streptomyces anulatus]WTD11068.1 hypothetical protein OHA54_18325 [Streptomyces anulatus]WTE04377.1 hypothetical protein OH765_18425 [Streptomyces anulatus]
MSVDVAYPLFHTPDPALALHVARQLLSVGDQEYARVRVDVELPRVEDVLHVLSAMPDAWFRKEDVDDWVRDPSDPTGLHGGVHAPQLTTDAAFLSTHLPLWASMERQPVGSIEDTFTAVASKYMAEIHWDFLGWPEVPEHGLYADYKHAEISVLFHASTRELDEWSNRHTVLVHVRSRNGDGYEERHASWLAEQIGQTVIGPPQFS